jgi:hypothetical protein
VKTALFAWELGANLGHASPMAEIARGLAGDGVRIVVAGRALDGVAIGTGGASRRRQISSTCLSTSDSAIPPS